MTTVLLIEYPPAVRDALRARLSLERDMDTPTPGAIVRHDVVGP
jgi:hypothetical protein